MEASVEETRANLIQLGEKEANTRRLLALEQRSLALAKKSIDRKSDALKSNAISQDDVDRETRIYLQQEQIVQQLENTLALIPSQRKAFNAALRGENHNPLYISSEYFKDTDSL